ncbi:MAG: GNAT family N-acetyltransferase [Jatrophihabitantaceae bacterium]
MPDRPQLRLQPMTERHLADFAGVVNDPEVARFTRFPAPAPDTFAREWYARYEAGRLAGTHEAFAALDPDGRFVGLALAPHLDAEAREAELGYLVPVEQRGRGVASELLRQLTDWAFAEREILRAGLVIDVENVASQRVAVRAGYRHEGTMRSTYFKQGLRSDVQIWSRLPSDPPPDC